MATPITSRRLQLDPLGWLTDIELEMLRSLLWDPMNVKIDVENGSVLCHDADIWVSYQHRGKAHFMVCFHRLCSSSHLAKFLCNFFLTLVPYIVRF